MARGISEGASKKNLVVLLFGDVYIYVLGHSFVFLKNMQCFCVDHHNSDYLGIKGGLTLCTRSFVRNITTF